jgi:hypothetical protein
MQKIDDQRDRLKAIGQVNLDRTPDDELLAHPLSSGPPARR